MKTSLLNEVKTLLLEEDISKTEAIKLSKRTRLILEYSFVIFITSLLIIFYFRTFNITLPLGYSGDFLFQLSGVKELLTVSPWSTNGNIGAPQGLNMLDYPQSDNFHLFMIYLLLLFTKNAVIATNIFYLLTFLFSSLTAYYALRKFELPLFISLPGALAFAFLPFHILRAGHLYLSAYYLIPFMILLIYQVVIGKINFFHLYSPSEKFSVLSILRNRDFWISLILCLIFGSSGIYYAFFAAGILFLFAIKSFLTKSYQKSFTLFIILGMLGFTLLLNLSPSIIYKAVNGPPSTPVGVRVPSETEIYGLKIIQMLLPSPVHKLSLFRNLSNTYSANFPLVTENITSSLGIIGSIGFLTALILLFSKKREDHTVNFLSLSNFSCLLLGTIGGFGTLFALLISPQIRAYNRISVIIAFIAIAQFCWMIKYYWDSKVRAGYAKQILKYVVFAFLMGLVFFDQIWIIFPLNQGSFKNDFESDKAFVQEIESLMPSDAMIFQLPYMAFPEVPPLHDLTDYSLFRPYLHSTKLRWSYGAMKGRESSEWNRLASKLPVNEMVKTLSDSNFSGIYIARQGYTEKEWVDLEDSINNVLQMKPIISNNGKSAFYDLQSYKKN